MDFALQPNTPSGSRFVELAEKHVTDFATSAGQRDREGSFPFENIRDMKKAASWGPILPWNWQALAWNLLTTQWLGSIGWAVEMARPPLARQCTSSLPG